MTTAIDEERLSETFGALANSTRRAILARLAQGEATVNELAEQYRPVWEARFDRMDDYLSQLRRQRRVGTHDG
jgi:DNA-binding transcriptional ArsR family regulator